MGVLPRLATGLPATQPLPCKFSAQGFPCILFTSLPFLGFVGKHSCCTNPFYYVILWASSTHLLSFYLFYSHGFFVKSFWTSLVQLPHIYFLLLLGLIGFWANPLSLLTPFLGFLGPFSHSLPLIIPMGLLLHSLGFLGPLTPSLPLFILVGPTGHQSCHSSLLGLLYYFLFPF